MEEVARKLLDMKAVQIKTELFTWSSGIKSPIYTDNRIIISYPKVRNFIARKMAKIIKKEFPGVESLFGVATSGIAHAAYVSTVLNLPMGYVRSSKKEHGKQNIIEGKIIKNQKVVVIEDLFSTGGSTKEAISELEKVGVKVLGAVSIFTYNLDKLEIILKGIKHHSLTNLDELLDVGLKNKYITNEEAKLVKEFRKNL